MLVAVDKIVCVVIEYFSVHLSSDESIKRKFKGKSRFSCENISLSIQCELSVK